MFASFAFLVQLNIGILSFPLVFIGNTEITGLSAENYIFLKWLTRFSICSFIPSSILLIWCRLTFKMFKELILHPRCLDDDRVKLLFVLDVFVFDWFKNDEEKFSISSLISFPCPGNNQVLCIPHLQHHGVAVMEEEVQVVEGGVTVDEGVPDTTLTRCKWEPAMFY